MSGSITQTALCYLEAVRPKSTRDSLKTVRPSDRRRHRYCIGSLRDVEHGSRTQHESQHSAFHSATQVLNASQFLSSKIQTLLAALPLLNIGIRSCNLCN